MTSKNYLPTEWSDDVRMNYLFTEFKPRDVNPEGYEDKMNFWCNLIRRYAFQTDTALFSVDQLEMTFERKGARPQCLLEVFKYIKGNVQDIIPLSKYEESLAGWLKWGSNLAFKPVGWLVGSFNEVYRNEQFVDIGALKRLRSKILKAWSEQNFTDNTIPYQTIWSLSSDICQNNEELFQLLLRGLEKDLELTWNTETITFKNSKFVKPLSEEEKAERKLEDAKTLLNKCINELQAQVSSCTREALEAKRAGQTKRALFFMRKLKRFEAQLDKQYKMLDNLHELEVNLDSQKNMGNIFQGYKQAAEALKAVHLNADNVESVMDQISEAMDQQDDISQAMQSVAQTSVASDADLEQELMQLVEEEESSLKLPNVPDTDVGEDVVSPENGTSSAKKMNRVGLIDDDLDDLLPNPDSFSPKRKKSSIPVPKGGFSALRKQL